MRRSKGRWLAAMGGRPQPNAVQLELVEDQAQVHDACGRALPEMRTQAARSVDAMMLFRNSIVGS